MKYRSFLRNKTGIAVIAALVILVLAGVLANQTIVASRNSSKMVAHTYRVLAKLDDLQSSVGHIISDSRGYVLTRDRRFIRSAREAAAQAMSDKLRVGALTSDNPRQQKLLPELDRRVENCISAAELLLARRTDNASAIMSWDNSVESSLTALSETLGALKSHELKLLSERLATTQDTFSLSQKLLLAGTFVGLAITILAGIGAARDNRRRQSAEEALFVEKERAQITLSSIGDGVISTNTQGEVTFINHAATLLTGWPAWEALGRPFTEVFKIIDAETREAVPTRMHMAIEHGRTAHLPDNSLLVSRDGKETPIEDTAAPIYGGDGNITGAVKVFRDVSAVRALTERLHHWAQHDFLTGLPNRVLFNDRLHQALTLAKREKGKIAVLFLDLDGFKSVNDRYGHAIGDKLLQGVGLRIRQCLRECDTLCRLGGDEFVVLLNRVADVADAKTAAERVLATFQSDVIVDGHATKATASIGVAVYPDDAETAETLLVCADAAMYLAKLRGRNMVCLYSDTPGQGPIAQARA